MIDSSWKNVTFGDVVELRQGLCFNKKTNHLMAEKGIPLLRIKDLINETETKFVDEENVPRKFVSDFNDIIYTRTGQVGLVFRGRVGVVHNNCFRVIPNKNIISSYLYWYLKQQAVIDYAKTIATGAAQPDLSHTAFKSIPFKYPDLSTQQKIASILSAFDNLIENSTRRIQILEEMAQRIYREWFVHFRFPGHDNVKMVDSELGRIPGGWKFDNIGSIAEVKGGKRLPKGKTVLDQKTNHPYLRVKDFKERGLNRSGIKFIDDETYQAVSRYTISCEDIYISIAGTIGRVGTVPKDLSGANLTENAAKICNIDKIVNKHYLVHCLNSSEGQYQITSKVTGTSQPKLALYKIKELPILIPPKNVMFQSTKIFSAFANMVENLERTNFCLCEIRDLLLPKLISGKIDVSDLEIDNGATDV